MSSLILALLINTLVSQASTAVQPKLYDWKQPHQALSVQRKPPAVSVDPIVSPTTGAPALVAWGQRLHVTVACEDCVDTKCQDWLMTITSQIRSPDGKLIGIPVPLRYSLVVDSVTPGPLEQTVTLSTTLPATPPRDVYHLEVTGPGGLSGRRIYAIRVLGKPIAKKFRFAVLSDHQLGDPSTDFAEGNLNNRSFPRFGKTDAESMLLQQVSEISFQDPDFVLYLGDLVFGTDYQKEYQQIFGHYWSRPLASYMVPGNHDAMALYVLALKEGWWTEAIKSAHCAKHVIGRDLTARSVFDLLVCLYGDLKKMLFSDLEQDGLDYWRRYLGATDFSFDIGDYHFVGLNSYAGTPERRHGFVLGLDFLGIDLGVATVDNYGGWLTDQQLDWLSKDLQQAHVSQKRIILFLHHDPRGNRKAPWTKRYHSVLPFPTEPLGLRMFQEWNYEGNPEWDSDKNDRRTNETQTKNSAVRLLKLISSYVDYVITGHIHDDQDNIVDPGQEITKGSGILTAKKVHFIRIATGSSTPLHKDGYWGFRHISANKNGLANLQFKPKAGRLSIPSGNLWLMGRGVPLDNYVLGSKKGLLYSIYNGLDRPVTGLVRTYLDSKVEGYHFQTRSVGSRVWLEDIGLSSDNRTVYYLRVKAAPTRTPEFPPPRGSEKVTRVFANRATGNQVPKVSFSRSAKKVYLGQAIQFDGSETKDPEGQPIVLYRWQFSDGHSARGARTLHTFERLGNYTVRLTAVDNCGAYASHTQSITVIERPSCAYSNAACQATSAAVSILCLTGLVLWYVRRRRKQTSRPKQHSTN